jgi:hypothetical protein
LPGNLNVGLETNCFMSKRILLIDSHPGLPAIVNAATALEVSAALLAKDADAARSWFFGRIIEGNSLEADDVSRAARDFGADGILLPFSEALPACAAAAECCGLPGIGARAASVLQSRSETSLRLRQRGVPALEWIRAESASELKRLAEGFDTPPWVAGDAACALSAMLRLDFAEDAPLAFSRSTRRGEFNAAAVAHPLDGFAYYVDCSVFFGEIRALGVIRRDVGEQPFLFDRAASLGPGSSEEDGDFLIDVASSAIEALDISSGVVRVSALLSPKGAVVTDVALGPSALWFPIDLVRLSSGVDEMAVALHVALGEPPRLERSREYGAALRWLPTRSGVISEVVGIEAARAVSGVVEVAAFVNPGDVMRHVVDCETRDRIGYVAAEGETAEAARRAVDEAVASINIVTRPAF